LQRNPRAAIDLQIGSKSVNMVEERIDPANNDLRPGSAEPKPQ